jgi:hypothetical protein
MSNAQESTKKAVDLHIFVNGKKKTSAEDGVTSPMAVDAIAKLAGLDGSNAVVRKEQGESGKAGEPLSGEIDVKEGEHFFVTRKTVEGGSR